MTSYREALRLAKELDKAIARAEAAEKVLRAASHALRSYQYGNSSTELAQEIADKCDAVLGAKL